MKKFLFGILIFLGIGLSFCSADNVIVYSGTYSCVASDCVDQVLGFVVDSSIPAGTVLCYEYGFRADSSDYTYTYSHNFPDYTNWATYGGVGSLSNIICSDSWEYWVEYGTDFWNLSPSDSSTFVNYFNVYMSGGNSGGGEDTGSVSEIIVYYNNGSSTETITCDGTQAIEIQGLSTITSTNTFTPYFNIDYIDENNQILTESYSKDILYLSGAIFKKTYTGNNDWILTVQGNNSENQFSGYIPVFDVTGSTQPVDTDYNMFNNFADNSLKVLLSNIPAYIQWVFIIMIILFLLGLVNRLRGRKK